MSTIADLIIKVRADTGGAESDIKSFGSKVGGGFKKALVPATAALGVMGIVGKAAFDNLQDGANNAKQTEAVLKSTGDASHVTAAHVDELAMSLRRKAGVDDDVVHSGENMLLTFTNIRNEAGKGNDVFDQATKTMLDMSHALGQDTKSSAIQLGKALNDPIKGITALQRVGVSFTDSQRKQIKTLVDSGHSMAAQKLILHELNREFGGSAENIDPTTKALANMKLDAVDLASNLVAGLMPALQFMAGLVEKLTGFMTEHGTATKIVVGIMAGLAVTVIAVNIGMKLYAAGALLVKAATAGWTAAQWLLNAALDANPIAIVIIALVALGAAIAVAWAKSQTFRNIVEGAWNGIKDATSAFVGFFTKSVPHAFDVVKGAIVDGLNGAKDWVKTHWPEIATIISGPFAPIVALATGAFGIRAKLSAAWDDIKNDARSMVGRIASAIGGIGDGIVAAIKAPINALIGILDAFHISIGKVSILGHTIFGGMDWHPFHIPMLAEGARNFVGGLAIVGERGPELVNLPTGSDVYTNADTRRMLGDHEGGRGRQGPLIGEAHIHNDVDVEVLAERVARKLAFQS